MERVLKSEWLGLLLVWMLRTDLTDKASKEKGAE